ncbi:MAG TPA: class I SAM-dependent methyltransferase [Jatrophihabitantaceae bacterium]|jgi:cyclopropane-fatty-acyl-phospholipid synthase|nr:class I SAM-dependent methyltransferase [Jatrophihabitantaceae bacterium]
MPRKPLANLLHDILGGVPIRVVAYDGSTTGPVTPDLTVHIRSPKALSYLLSAPGSLGMARAYVTGEIGLDGDLYTALSYLWSDAIGSVSWAQRLDALRNIDPKALRWVEAPPEEYGARRWRDGFRHSRRRDAGVISHHYDVSNTFYEWVLGPSMTYTCACYPTEAASLEEAQAHKYDLVCRKLGLQRGMRLLDVGCGWGGMVRHAAKEYGVHAVGVTLSRAQAEWGAKAVAAEGLSDVAEVRRSDYRDVSETGFDAVSSIGLTEHIGLKNLPDYFAFLHDKLRPQGRLLNHCITRPTTDERTRRRGFIDRYVFPDGELEGVGTIVSAMQDNGFEVRHEENLREHYAKTLTGWCDNLLAHWDEAAAEIGEPKARVWLLYMTGSRLGFERRVIELHQVLGVRSDGGRSAMPLRPDWGV